MTQRNQRNDAAQVAQALMWGDKTAREVGEFVGISTAHAQVYIDTFRAAGCAYRTGEKRVQAYSNGTRWASMVYAWQPKPFHFNEDTQCSPLSP